MDAKTEKVKSLFDKPEGYLRKHYDISLRTLIVRELLGEVGNARILDIGCGDGSISLQYAAESNRIVLLDLSENMLAVAKENTPESLRNMVQYVHADLREYHTEELFDIVLCIGVLAHVVSVEETITKISELLKPGGRCVIQITDNDQMSGKFMNAYYRVRNKASQTNSYPLNKTGLSSIVSSATRHGLTLLQKRRYLAPFLGMGKMPNEWLFKYELFTMRQHFISRFGSEAVGLYQRDSAG